MIQLNYAQKRLKVDQTSVQGIWSETKEKELFVENQCNKLLRDVECLLLKISRTIFSRFSLVFHCA